MSSGLNSGNSLRSVKTGSMPIARTDFVAMLCVSVVEPEMQHVAVGDDIILAFQAELTGFTRAGFAFARDIVGIGDGFRTNEALLEIGVNDTSGLRRA